MYFNFSKKLGCFFLGEKMGRSIESKFPKFYISIPHCMILLQKNMSACGGDEENVREAEEGQAYFSVLFFPY